MKNKSAMKGDYRNTGKAETKAKTNNKKSKRYGK